MPPKNGQTALSGKLMRIEQAKPEQRRIALTSVEQGSFIQHVVYADEARTEPQGLCITRVAGVPPPASNAPGRFLQGIFIAAEDKTYAARAAKACGALRVYHLCCCNASECCAKPTSIMAKRQGVTHISEWRLLRAQDVETIPWASAALAGEAGMRAKLPPGSLPIESVGGPVPRTKDESTKVKTDHASKVNQKGSRGRNRGTPKSRPLKVQDSGAPVMKLEIDVQKQRLGKKRQRPIGADEPQTEEAAIAQTKQRILDLSVQAAERAARLVGVELRNRGSDSEEANTMMAVFVDKYTTALLHERQQQALREKVKRMKVEVRAKIKNENERKNAEEKEKAKFVVKQEAYVPIERVIVKPKCKLAEPAGFDGSWEVNADEGHKAEIIGGKCKWFDGETYDFSATGKTTCTLMFKGETLEGTMSEDGESIAWDDDGEWKRKSFQIAYRCGLCPDTFKLYSACYRHRQVKHRVNLHWRICDLCDRQFLNNSMFRHHLRERHGITAPKVPDFRASCRRSDRNKLDRCGDNQKRRKTKASSAKFEALPVV